MNLKNLNVKKISHKKLILHLNDKKIRKIYNIFRKNIANLNFNSPTAVALSGGPDSLALAFLMKCYSIENKSVIEFFHVDHGLRKVSKFESVLLKKKLKPFDINVQILRWKGNKPLKNIQSAARKNRYKLITDKLSKKNINKLLIAHTEDDVLENFLIRLLRGSGLQGFVSFNKVLSNYKKFLFIRPLINVKKKNLIYITNKVFSFYIDDISNKDHIFKRVRIRKIIKDLNNEGLDQKKINLTINNLTSSNETINFYVNQNILNNSKHVMSRNQFILNKSFFLQPTEIIFRSISKILLRINEKYYLTRGKKIINAISQIKESKINKLTISGCIIEKYHNSYLIYPEKLKKRRKIV